MAEYLDYPVQISNEILEEFRRASAMFPPIKSAHEGYAVILEELDELWEEIKKNPARRDKGAMRREALQVGAMALRFIYDVTG